MELYIDASFVFLFFSNLFSNGKQNHGWALRVLLICGYFDGPVSEFWFSCEFSLRVKVWNCKWFFILFYFIKVSYWLLFYGLL